VATIGTDREKCAGYANCVMTAESYFELDDDGVVRAIQSVVAAEDQGVVAEAVESCPVSALTLRA